jgi:predicted dehydrogenase
VQSPGWLDLNVVVIGYGSIGSRHARLLGELGHQVAVVSARPVAVANRFQDTATAIARHEPEYVVVANATNLHRDTLSTVRGLGYTGRVLVEKPVFDHSESVSAQEAHNAFVAYNLRFSPVIRRLRNVLLKEKILSVHAYAGQYLPEWRPTTDYRDSYSASAARGGGALRDLSHELDYLSWMLGGWQKVSALGGRLSSLQITSDDVFTLLMSTPACPVVSVQINYLDRAGRRFIIVNTDRHTIEADLIAGTLQIDRDREVFATERDGTYRAMHEAVLAGETASLCSIEEGLNTLKLIEAAELSARRGEWVIQ